ncbi:MAG: phage tail spike protein [Clostridium sp.]|uniref:phage tail spike protein n=1 Tax=Clostridium sp. TaxID=1506 RepID=UPI0039994952
MIEAYKSTNTNFDFNGDMVLKPSLCDLEVELNGMIEVTLEHQYDKLGRWKYIEEDNIIRVPYPGKQEGQLFYIYDKDKGMTGVKCKARHIFFDLASEVLVDCRPTNCNGKEALRKMLEGTGFTGHSDIISINTAHYIRKHIANEALISDDENSFMNKWGGELDVDNFNVYMNNRTGGEYGVTFKYGRDLINLNENSNIDSIITRVIPVGFNGITIPETYVESPLINKYRKVKTDVVKFDYIKVKESPEDEEGYDTLEEAQEALREAAKELFNDGLDKLLYQLDLEVTKLENTLKYEDYKDILTTGLGDTVGVEHIDIGIDIKTRVIKFTYDCIKEKYKTITIGNYIENDIDRQNSVESTLDKITNADGTVNAVEVAGILNAVNVKMRAMKDIAQKQDVRALLCEDLDPESPTYGAMCYGTMGFMIAAERTPDNRDWNWRTFGTGKGFFADLIVAGTMLADRIRGGVLQSIDGSLEIDLRESSKGMQFKRNGKKAIDIAGTTIKFFDWDGEGDAVAHIYSTRIGGDENKLGLAIANKKDRSISISYESGDNYYSYMRFDMDNSDKITNSPITIFKETDFRGSQIWFGYDINSIYNSTNNNLIAKVQNEFKVADRANGTSRFRVLQDWIAAYDKDSCYFEAGKLKSDGKGYFIFRDGQTAYLYRVAGQEKVWCDYNLTVDKKLHVNGDLAVVGNKNCIQPTENYGDRLFYSVEDAESYLTDRSMEVFTVEKTEEGTYERVILLDNIFKEAVRVDNNYTVEVIKQGWGDYRVKEQNENYFVVEADRKDFTFKYVVTAKRRGFEDIRLDEYYKVENDIEVINVEDDLTTNLVENEICEELNI